VCTASWLIQAHGFELFFNRDESVRRGTALAPEVFELGGVRVLAPRDADAGGTWLGVNECGLALALLNAWDAREALAGARSRGLLVRELLAERSAGAVLERLEQEDLACYRGFTLAAFEPGRAPLLWAWDGRLLENRPAVSPLASSSLDRARAQAERARVYADLVEEGGARRESLERFQASHAPARGPWSPCMHRADAATVSASQVRVTPRSVEMRYAPGPPCVSPFGPWIELERGP
jgi:hypothetical protein